METMTKLSNLFGLSKNKGPITTVQKVKLVKKDLNSHMLPKSDKITILNTIKKADQIYFVNDGEVIPAESLDKSLEMIEKSKRKS